MAAETLAEEALERLFIAQPEVDRNPKLGSGGLDASLV